MIKSISRKWKVRTKAAKCSQETLKKKVPHCNSRKMFIYSRTLEQICKSSYNKYLGPDSTHAKILQQLKCPTVELLTGI